MTDIVRLRTDEVSSSYTSAQLASRYGFPILTQKTNRHADPSRNPGHIERRGECISLQSNLSLHVKYKMSTHMFADFHANI